MPQLIEESKRNYAFKWGLGIFHTNNTWLWFAEKFKNEPAIIASRIWGEDIPYAGDIATADSNATNYDQITKISSKLTLEPGHNNRVYRARVTPGDSGSALIQDSISPVDAPNTAGSPSAGYSIRLFEDDGAGNPGTEIPTTSGAWVWHYKLCALLLDENHTAADEGWTTPLHVTFYQYTGLFVTADPPPTEAKTEVITADALIDSGTTFDIRFSESSPNYTRSRDEITDLKSSATEFRDTESIQVYLNGNQLEKGSEIIWLSDHTFNITYVIGDGDKITIIDFGEVPASSNLVAFLNKRVTRIMEYKIIPEITILSEIAYFGSESISGNLAIGFDSSTNNGGILVAKLSFNIDTENPNSTLDSVKDDNDLTANIVYIRDAITQQPIVDYFGRRVFALIQCSLSVSDGNAIATEATPNVQLVFISQTPKGLLYKVKISGKIQIALPLLYTNKTLLTNLKHDAEDSNYDGVEPVIGIPDFRINDNTMKIFTSWI